MPFFTEHGTLGGLLAFLIMRLLSVLLTGQAVEPGVWEWVAIMFAFTVGSLPDIIAMDYGSWKPWEWKRNDELYFETHYGSIAQWVTKRWWQVWPLPYIIHIYIDRPFHTTVGSKAERTGLWWMGEALHLIVNATLVLAVWNPF